MIKIRWRYVQVQISFFIVGHLVDCFEKLGNLPINDLIIVCMSILFLLFTLFIYTGEIYVCVCTIFINKIFVLNNLALYLDVPPSHPTKLKYFFLRFPILRIFYTKNVSGYYLQCMKIKSMFIISLLIRTYFKYSNRKIKSIPFLLIILCVRFV